MFDDDLLAVVVAIMPRVRGLEMHGAVMAGHDLLPVGPMARLHFMRTGRLRLRGLNAFLRRCSGRRCGEHRRPEAEGGSGREYQHKLIHDVLLGDDKQSVSLWLVLEK